MTNKKDLKDKINNKEEKPKVKMIEVECPHCGKMTKTPEEEYNHRWTVTQCKHCGRYTYRGISYKVNPKA